MDGESVRHRLLSFQTAVARVSRRRVCLGTSGHGWEATLSVPCLHPIAITTCTIRDGKRDRAVVRADRVCARCGAVLECVEMVKSLPRRLRTGGAAHDNEQRGRKSHSDSSEDVDVS